MKKLILFMLVAFSGYAAVLRPISLEWEYPTNQISDDLVFRVFTTTNIAQPRPWAWVTNVVGTNLPLTNLSVRLEVEAGMHFYYVSASNFWGEAPSINWVGTPYNVTNPASPALKRLF